MTSRYYYVTDGQGSVVALTDGTGNVVNRYAYDAWGTLTSASEGVPQRLRYRGYWFDAELGTYWLGVRAYSPALRRFLQPDPDTSGGAFDYTYVGDDPVDAADSSGLGTCLVGYPNGGHEYEDCAHAYAEDAPEGDTVTPVSGTGAQGLGLAAGGAMLPHLGAAPACAPEIEYGLPPGAMPLELCSEGGGGGGDTSGSSGGLRGGGGGGDEVVGGRGSDEGSGKKASRRGTERQQVHAAEVRQINAVAREFHIDRRAFGDWVENVWKEELGIPGAGQLTYQQIREGAEVYIEEGGK